MTDALKPCPFCLGEPNLEDHRLVWMVKCAGCGASVLGKRANEPDEDMPDDYWDEFEASAIEAWNLRAPDAPVSAPGWVLVPIEPTPEMIAANGHNDHPEGAAWLARDARETWAAMLAAAPLPEAQQAKTDVHSAERSVGQSPAGQTTKDQ